MTGNEFSGGLEGIAKGKYTPPKIKKEIVLFTVPFNPEGGSLPHDLKYFNPMSLHEKIKYTAIALATAVTLGLATYGIIKHKQVTPVEAKVTEWRQYGIQEGDKCWTLAGPNLGNGDLRFQVVDQMESLNGINCGNLQPGRNMQIPRTIKLYNSAGKEVATYTAGK